MVCEAGGDHDSQPWAGELLPALRQETAFYGFSRGTEKQQLPGALCASAKRTPHNGSACVWTPRRRLNVHDGLKLDMVFRY
jgi:hypothetical protein